MIRVIPGLMALNIGVYLGWLLAPATVTGQEVMAQHFLVSWTALSQGRWWTLLTSVFSHNLALHLLLNMFVLNSFGPIIEHALGAWRFLKFYLGAGILASLSHALCSMGLLHQSDLPALGASGGVAGVVLLFSLVFPKEKILVLGFIPLPAILGALAFVALDIWGLVAQVKGHGLPIGHGAHLGGAIAGLIYFLYLRSRRRNGKVRG